MTRSNGRARRWRSAPARSSSRAWTATGPRTATTSSSRARSSEACPVPVIASGGVGTLEHLLRGLVEGSADAVLAASIFHFGTHTIAEAKRVPARARCRRYGASREPSTSFVWTRRACMPAVVQEADTGEVLMVAWMDRGRRRSHACRAASPTSGRARADDRGGRARRPGTSSTSTAVYADCDGDTLLVQVHQEGVACHTGQRTCFFTALKGGDGDDPRPAPSGHARTHRARASSREKVDAARGIVRRRSPRRRASRRSAGRSVRRRPR